MAIIKTLREMEKLTKADQRQKYISDIGTLFNPTTNYGPQYEDKDWVKEFENLHYLLTNMDNNIQEELFIITCETYLVLRKQQTTSEKLIKSNEEFLKFINKSEFTEYLTKIPQNIFKTEVYYIINQCITNDNLIQAEQFLNIFLLPENKNLSHFNQFNTLYTILINNKKNNLNFLLDNLEGWNDSNILTNIFNLSPLDDTLLDKLMSKTPGTNYTENNILASFYNRDIPAVRKVQILNKIGAVNNPSLDMYSFYVENFNSGKLNGQILVKFDDPYITNLNNLEFMKSWFKKSGAEMQKVLPALLPLGFINQTLLQQNILTCLSEPKEINTKDCNLIEVLQILKIDHNDPQYQRTLLNLMDYSNNQTDTTYNAYFKGLKYDINLKEHNETFPYNNIEHFLKEKNSILYDLLKFNHLPKKEKEKSYDNIMTKLHSVTNFSIDNETINSLYNFSRNNHSAHDFFINTFINNKFVGGTTKEIVLRQFLTKFAKDQEPLILNLPEENPFHNLFEQSNVYHGGKNYFFQELSQYFHGVLNNTKNIQGFTVLQAAEKHSLQQHLSTSPTIKKKGFFNFKFLNPTEPDFIQLVRNPSGTQLITDPAKKLDIPGQTAVIENNEDKSFNSLVDQASKDLKNLQILLDAHADKSLNIEVKIRSETILLHNLNFLTNLKDTTDDIAFEDMYFLKNNLNKYLFQCLNTYIKSVARYEVLSEPGNKLNTKSEDELEKQKEKIDNEALKQIGLLEKELELVKEHIVQQINRDLLTDMKVTTRVLQNRVEDSENRSEPDNSTVVQIRRP